MLKLIALITMLIDHVGFIFFPYDLTWRLIGRLAFPIFAFGIAEGYTYTRDWRKYLLRLLILAIISQPIFLLTFKSSDLNVVFTLAGGLLLIHCYESLKPWFLKYLSIILVLVSAWYFNFEYGALGVLLILVFYIFRKKPFLFIIIGSLIFVVYSIMNQHLIYLGSIAALFLIQSIPRKRLKLGRYFFYIFYPGHLLVLYLLSRWL